jgi:Pentapeptide repeats (8 copies)
MNLFHGRLDGINFWSTDLRGANLSGTNLFHANLIEATLIETDLTYANLEQAYLTSADLSRANLAAAELTQADLLAANLTGADLSDANLFDANLSEAQLSYANIRGANLTRARLIETNFEGANLTGCTVYGVSAWRLNLTGAQQSDLVITPADEPKVTVDNLEVAQFIHLLLDNEKIRGVIDTIGKKGVLILGRFSGERKAVLDALRMALRQRDFLPMVFDFEKPTQRDFTETIMTLAGLSLFVIADITNPRSAPLELQATVPDYMIPFVPIIAEGEPPISMFIDLQRKFDWVLDVLEYDSIDHLLTGLQDAVIVPALQKHEVLVQRRVQTVGTRHIQQYLHQGDAHL